MKKLLFVLLLILTACAGGSGGAGDPADTVERYLTAKVGGDGDTVRALLCSEMESVVEREANSFVSVTDPRIENMECTRDGDTDVVRCTGTITAVYGTETATFDLTAYRVVQEDGEWKWCGETQ